MHHERSQEILKIEPRLSKKQKQALRLLLNQNNGVSSLVYGGAAGGGKSWVGCVWVLLLALQHAGSTHLIGRSKLSELKKTTLVTLFKVFKEFKLKETEHYKYNQSSNKITLYNGSTILLQDLFTYPSDPLHSNLAGLEISSAFVDEANQVTEFCINQLTSRIRYLDEFGLAPKMLLTCNPSRGWIYSEYYKKKKENKLEAYKEYLPAFVTDNPYISKHYIKTLERLDPISKRRLLYGDWEYADDLALFKYDAILNSFQRHAFVKEESNEDTRYYAAIDVARLGKDKTCIVIFNNRKEFVEVIELEKQTLDVQKQKVEELKTKYGIYNTSICIDADGVGGGLVDFLPGAISVVNNSRAKFEENYQNLKTQLYCKLAELVNGGQIRIKGLSDDQALRLTQELQVIKREKVDLDGKVSITSKEQIKKEISRSPDLSDAMAYACYFFLENGAGEYTFEAFEY